MEVIVRKPTQEELDELGVTSWPIWECEPSAFDWEYDERETCFILEGDVTVTGAPNPVHFGPGDLVIFPQGLRCRWSVAKKVRKHYQFG
jgi:uncharacterized cupin superfamily protein